MKKILIYGNVVLIFAIFLFSNLTETYESSIYCASDNNKIIFENKLKKGDKLSFFSERGNNVDKFSLVLYKEKKEILKIGDIQNINSENKLEYIVEQSGIYSMKILYNNVNCNKNDSIIIYWKILK